MTRQTNEEIEKFYKDCTNWAREEDKTRSDEQKVDELKYILEKEMEYKYLPNQDPNDFNENE